MTLIASHETTEIWSGTENIIARSLDVLRRINSTYDLCVDRTGPIAILSAQPIREAYVELERRGVRVRIITEILPDNISQTKELSKIAELRHLGGVIGNFTIADMSDYAGSPETENGILTKLIVSNVNSFVRLQQYFFNTLWDKAIPGDQRIRELEEGREAEVTEIWRDPNLIVSRSLEILSSLEKQYDFCVDWKGPSIIITLDYVKKAYLDIVSRGGKLRLITEIIPENLAYCKQIAGFAEVRHLDSIKGNFGIVDQRIYGGTDRTNERQAHTSYLHSTVREFVDQQQYLFETLWEKAVPAEYRIRQIEEGIEPEKTEIIQGVEKIIKSTFEDASNTKKNVDNCIDKTGPSSFFNTREVWNLIIDTVQRGVKLRFITEITPENLSYCKEFAKVLELRHLDKVKGNFGIHDGKKYRASASVREGLPPDVLVISTVRAFVAQQQFFFETLWEKAQPAEVRIKEIEDGREPEKLELIPDTEKSIGLAFDVMKRTEKEFLVLFATSRAFLLATTMDPQLVYRTMSDKGATVRILVPDGEGVEGGVRKVLDAAPKVQLRVTDANLSTRITIMISDRREFMSWELKDDTVDDPYRAGGVATYSNNRSLAESYATIFENLWRITEFAENLKAANTRLERNDQAMREFIDIAAHELRNPIQPILGLSEILHERQNYPDQKDLVEVIVRNAHRLQQLADDVLDITRFESGKLQLALQRVDLMELVAAIVHDFQGLVQSGSSNDMRIFFINEAEEVDGVKGERLIVLGDANRMGQVFTNILSNAVKFTSEGRIVVRISRLKNGDGHIETVISISDTGSGIDSSIMHRLFEKFVSRSEKGIGLGLYLSKKIVDAHGGRIWAQNNADGIGATFYVALPVLME